MRNAGCLPLPLQRREKKNQGGETPDFKESKGYTNRFWVNIRAAGQSLRILSTTQVLGTWDRDTETGSDLKETGQGRHINNFNQQR